MSARDDASLTDRERTALAGLEARAAAEDPHLASRLMGSSRLAASTHSLRIPAWLRGGWWAGPLIAVGLVLVVVSLSAVWMLGVVGAAIAACGLWLVTGAVGRHWGSTSPRG